MRSGPFWDLFFALGLAMLVGCSSDPGAARPEDTQVDSGGNAPLPAPASPGKGSEAGAPDAQPKGSDTTAPQATPDSGVAENDASAPEPDATGPSVEEGASPPPMPTPSAGSSCLATSKSVTKSPPGVQKVAVGMDAQFLVMNPPLGAGYDMRESVYQTNIQQNPHGGANVENILPIVFDNPAGDLCVVGPKVIGVQPRGATWQTMKGSYDGDGVRWQFGKGRITIEGAWMDNLEDAIGPPKGPTTDRSTYWVVNHSYFRYIRDDFIENDACLRGEVNDVLVDGVHMFYSARPGKGNTVNGKADAKFTDILVHMSLKPDNRDPGGVSMAQLFKTSACFGQVTMKNAILRVDGISRNGVDTMDMAPGSYENVIIVWQGPGDDYPGSYPSGVKVTKDIDVWNKARSEWLDRHGCEPSGDNCTKLLPEQ